VTLTFDPENGVRVTCDVGYLYANFGLPRPLYILDFGPMYATDRQTKINAPPIRGGGITMYI